MSNTIPTPLSAYLLSAVIAAFTVISAGVIVITNGLSLSLALVFVAFAVLVDLLRAWLARFPEDARPSLGIIGHVVARPRLAYWIVGTAVVFLVLSYLAFPEICLQGLNDWIEANFALARHRLAALGPACSVEHGSVLLWIQLTMPIAMLLAIASAAISSRISPLRFWHENRARLGPSQIQSTELKKVIMAASCLFFLSAQSVADFGDVWKSMFGTLVPHKSLISVIKLLFIYSFPFVFFIIFFMRTAWREHNSGGEIE